MNEAPVLTVPAEAVTTEASPSAGALLRRAREEAGLHIAALAASIRVPQKKLEALEADRHEELPDAVFARALASSVCRALKIDPQPILQRLPRTDAPLPRSDALRINVPFQRPGEVEGRVLRSLLSRPAWLAALVLLAGALVLLFFPEVQEARLTMEATVSAPAAPAPLVTPPLSPAADTPAAPADVEPAGPVQSTAAGPASMTALPLSGMNAAADRPLLQFKSRGASWVEAMDAKGVVLLRRHLASGERVAVSGALPLSVVIGRADAIEVWVRGQPFPLQDLSRENVARFEVKP